jgi:hypothetical protein
VAYVPHPYDGEDFDDALTAALQRLAERLPGWTPREASVEYAVLSEMLRLTLDTRLLAADVADAIFRSFGTKLVGLPPHPGSPATGTAVFTVDEPGRTVPAGTAVLWPDGAGGSLPFVTATDASTVGDSLDTTPVQLVAESSGTAANGLPPVDLELVDALAYVTRVRTTVESAGGTDAEDDLTYLDRLSQSLQLLRRVPVLAADYAVLARDVPGVYRAMALDGYDVETELPGQERALAVAGVRADGSPLSADVAEALQVRLSSEREVNFRVGLVEPSYTPVAVTFTALADPRADPLDVLGAAIEAVRSFLSPAAWGGGAERPPVWRPDRTVRYLDVVGVLSQTPGLVHLDDVTVNGARDNVTLTGLAPLPDGASTVTGSVSTVSYS